MDDSSRLDLLSSVNLQNFNCCPQLRSTTLWRNSASDEDDLPNRDLNNDNDFLAVLTCATNLYAQDGVLEMRPADSKAGGIETVYGQGSLGHVTRVNADFAQPSNQRAGIVAKRVERCAAKRYAGGDRRESFLSGLMGGNQSSSLWDEHGNPRSRAHARSFVMELRILSHPEIRSSENIVKIHGLEWDQCQTIPKPIVLMEGAGWDLSQFLNEFTSLPSRTKWSFAHDIAAGLTTLHNCGIVHGDIKPDNILIFGDDQNLTAKLTDFSHSLFDTGEARGLPGGTEPYASPEWKDDIPSSQLKLTDVYSYGLTFACLMIGKDLFAQAYRENRAVEIRRHKYKGTMIGYLWQAVASIDDPNIDDQDTLLQIFNLTLQRNPEKRDLKQVMSILSGRSLLGDSFKTTSKTVSDKASSQEDLSIPYQALAGLPRSVHKYVANVLEYTAKSEDEPRAAAAAFELAVCYSSGFGIHPDPEVKDEEAEANAMAWFLQSAQGGDQRARLALVPVYEAFNGKFPPDLPLEDWLRDLVENHGCTTALDQLAGINPSLHAKVQQIYRHTYCGGGKGIFSVEPPVDVTRDPIEQLTQWRNDRRDTILHYCASTGRLDLLKGLDARGVIDSELLNAANDHGDTPLLQAMRAGHADMVGVLLALGAETTITNNLNETVLHFLVNIDAKDIPDIAQKLAAAGAGRKMQKMAHGSSSTSFNSLEMTGPGSAALRAVCRNNAVALQALIDIEASLPSSQHFNRTGKAAIWQLLAFAVTFHHSNVLDIIRGWLGSHIKGAINSRKFWNGNNLRTLLEACVFGPVSSNEASGFNYPERFTRILRFGHDHRKVLEKCLAFLIGNGALVNGKVSGPFPFGAQCYHPRDEMARFVVAHHRRDAMSCLSPYARSPLLWARLAIESEAYEIFHDFLKARPSAADDALSSGWGINFPVLFLGQIFAAGLDPVLLHIYTKWLRQTQDNRLHQWAIVSSRNRAQLDALAGRRIPFQFRPLYLAYDMGRLDIASLLFEHGARLQDWIIEAEGSLTVLAQILSSSFVQPGRLSELIECATASNSAAIVTMKDLYRLLPRPSDILSPEDQHERTDTAQTGEYYRRGVSWLQTDESSQPTLGWTKPVEEVRGSERLWAHIWKASRSQKEPIIAPPRDTQPDLLICAALDSNWAAVRCLLDMGFHPDGPLCFKPSLPSRPSISLPITPLDVVHWTSYVPDTCCSPRGLALKRSNEAIAALLLERGGTRAVPCNRMHYLLASPLLELETVDWRLTSEAIGTSLLLWAALGCFAYYIGPSFGRFFGFGQWYLVMVIPPLVLMTIGIYYGLIMEGLDGLRGIVKVSRKQIMIQLAFGGNARIFRAAMLGHDSILGRSSGARQRLNSSLSENATQLEEEVALLEDPSGSGLARDHGAIVGSVDLRDDEESEDRYRDS